MARGKLGYNCHKSICWAHLEYRIYENSEAAHFMVMGLGLYTPASTNDIHLKGQLQEWHSSAEDNYIKGLTTGSPVSSGEVCLSVLKGALSCRSSHPQCRKSLFGNPTNVVVTIWEGWGDEMWWVKERNSKFEIQHC